MKDQRYRSSLFLLLFNRDWFHRNNPRTCYFRILSLNLLVKTSQIYQDHQNIRWLRYFLLGYRIYRALYELVTWKYFRETDEVYLLNAVNYSLECMHFCLSWAVKGWMGNRDIWLWELLYLNILHLSWITVLYCCNNLYGWLWGY